MREVTFNVYEFNELSPEAQEQALENVRESLDHTEEVIEHLNSLIPGFGLPEVSIDEDQFRINIEDEEDSICLDGEITGFVRDKIPMAKYVSSAFVSGEDITNPSDLLDNGLDIFFSEDAAGVIDEDREEEFKEQINKELSAIRKKLSVAANDFMNAKSNDEEVKKIAIDKEYLEDGTIFE